VATPAIPPNPSFASGIDPLPPGHPVHTGLPYDAVMRLGSVWRAPAVSALAFVACVGNDPDPANSPSLPEGGANGAADGGAGLPVPGVDGSTSHGEAEAGRGASFIFATKDKHMGNLGGLDGADATCASLARTRGFPGVYRAWLSSSTTSAIDRIQGAGPWTRVDGTSVFASRDALKGVPLVAVLLDEEGGSISPSSNVWTGTRVGGVKSSEHCTDWTSSDGAGHGTWGQADKADTSWTESPSGGEPCNDNVRLLCLRAD
jgi:hypothetical protein